MPMTSGCIASSAVSAAPISVPTSMRPVVSTVTCTMIGSSTPAAAHRGAGAVDRGLRLQQVVDGLDEQHVDAARDAGPSTWSLVAVAQLGRRGSGRATAAGCPGPIEPITNRGRSGVEQPDATSRASSAARRLISNVLSAMPYSLSTSGNAPNVAVSTASTPTAKNSSCIWRDEVGPGEHELLVAAFERLAAEVVGAEVVALHPGAERAVEHEHALVQRVEERVLRAAADRVSASARIGPSHQVTWRRRGRRSGMPALVDSVRARRSWLPRSNSLAAARRSRSQAPTCSRCPCSPARRRSARAPTSSTTRSAARSLAFMAEAGFEGKRGEALAVPDRRPARRQGGRARRHGRAPTRSTPTRCAGPAPRSRGASSKVAKVATTLLDAAPDSLDRGDAAQAFAEGVALGALPVPHVQVRREAVEARARAGARPRQRQGARRHRPRRADRGGGRVGARPRQRAGRRRSRPTTVVEARAHARARERA